MMKRWLLGNKNKLGFAVGVINQLLWIYYALLLKQYGLLVGVIAYTIVNIRNWVKWGKN